MEKYSLLTETEKVQYEITPPEYDEVKHSFISEDNEAVITCVGDCLVEEKMYKSHLFGEHFGFDDVFQFVKQYFLNSDLSIANLETMICENAPYTGEQYKIGGKYFCNAPAEFLRAIKNSGINFLMLSNNHNLDCGVNGIIETLNRINELGFKHTGLFTPQDAKRYSIVEIKGIKIALMSYSTWFNRNEPHLTELGRKTFINEHSKEKVSGDIKAARQEGAEFVLVYIHWGTDAEYKTRPSESMKRMAQEIADSGADYIVGSHTHSVQPFAEITAANGKKVPCIYSMGNFVTSEISKISRQTVILQLKLKKFQGVVQAVEQKFVPCYIPDKFYNISYPVLPKGMGTTNSLNISAFNEDTLKTIGCETTHFGYKLTKKRICGILGLPMTKSDEEYTSLRFAADTVEGCAALISEISSQITYNTPHERCVRLADTAMEKGARLLVSTAQIKDYPCLITPLPIIETFTRIISEWRMQFDPKTISITGSIGKTSTTEMVYTLISSKYNTHRNTGSANNVRYSGTVVQQLKPEHEFYVQETMEGPPFGAAATIAKMVQPQAAVVTVVGTSHMEEFGSQERILESCLGVQEGMPEDGLLILNGDDPFQQKAVTERKTVYYAIENEKADYRAINIKNNEMGMTFNVVHGGETTPIRLNCFGKHNVLNALAAFAAGKWAGMTNEEIAAGLAKYRTSGIRQNLVRFGGQRIFLDCYNAAVESIRSSLSQLAEIPVGEGGKRIAVLADILECGDKAEEYHRSAGKAAAESKADIVICYGKDAKFIAEEAEKTKHTFYTDSADKLIELIKENVTVNDIVLFKGSHGMALEHIVDRIWGTWYHEEFERYDFLTHNKKDENFSYCVYTDHAALTNRISTTENVVISDNVDGKPVTSISSNAFGGSKTVKSVTFPKSLVNIRYCAFYNSSLSGEVKLPPSLRVIHDSAFSACKNLTIVIIAEGCTHLGYRAFGNCTSLESIVLPETVREIGREAFINCKKLTIFGKEGSYAEEYAKNNGIPFTKVI